MRLEKVKSLADVLVSRVLPLGFTTLTSYLVIMMPYYALSNPNKGTGNILLAALAYKGTEAAKRNRDNYE
jgi:hypothetical protein